ncbi:MAG: TlpA family protein disulfide reductase [Deltaproteobacteria bacterium]|nr:TlpA family protein disulfide reductase [Deltaproteobacteria bacterium]
MEPSRSAAPWRRLVITLAVLLPLIGILAYGFMRDPRYINSPLIGQQAAPFTVTLFDGKKLSLDDLRGKAVFLNFWASWCPPCRAEARDLEAAWQRVKNSDVVFLGVDIQDTEEDARAYLREFDVTYPNGRDLTGKVAVDYGVWGIPETFFIDPQGRITYKHVGSLGTPLITAKLEEARAGIVSAKEGKGSYQTVR